MRELVEAYHRLIDFEYDVYNQKQTLEEVYFSKREALNEIGKINKNAQDLFKELENRGFLVDLGEGKYRTLHFDIATRVANIRIRYDTMRYPLETKIFVTNDLIPSFRDHKFKELKVLVGEEIFQILKFALGEDVKGFSDFQWQSIKSILAGDKKAYILTAPTSGGKTYAFFIPILIKILEKIINNSNEKKIKAIFIYPRKSLERDQLSKIIYILYRVNFYLKEFLNKKEAITIGIDDGETPYLTGIKNGESYRGAVCPYCGKRNIGGELVYAKTVNVAYIRCKNCGETFEWIYPTKEEIWVKKPDILITNFWSLDWRLPSKTIQGEHKVYKGLEYVVMDEAHVYQSLLGGNVRYMLKRLKISSDNEFVTILSSATIPRPEEFAEEILDINKEDYKLIKSKIKGRKKKVIYQILAVHPRKSWETVVYELALLLSTVHYYRDLQGVIFIDSTKAINRIYYQHLKQAVEGYKEPKDHFNREIPRIDPYAFYPYDHKNKGFDSYTPSLLLKGISVHYSKVRDREGIEKEFVKGKVGVLLSTSTLELGIDYPKVSIIGMVGLPFKLESVPQRVGRAGRNVEKTLNTILAIVILRNIPIEMYYLYNPEEFIYGYLNKKLPVAWRNVAVKRYHALGSIVDYLASENVDTYVLKGDGKVIDLAEFIEVLLKAIKKKEVQERTKKLNSETREDSPTPFETLEELKREIENVSKKREDLESLRKVASIGNEVFCWKINQALERIINYAKEIRDFNLEKKVLELKKDIKELVRC